MIFIIMLKSASKEEDLYYKPKQKNQNLVTDEKDSEIKNLYEIEKFINK